MFLNSDLVKLEQILNLNNSISDEGALPAIISSIYMPSTKKFH